MQPRLLSRVSVLPATRADIVFQMLRCWSRRIMLFVSRFIFFLSPAHKHAFTDEADAGSLAFFSPFFSLLSLSPPSRYG